VNDLNLKRLLLTHAHIDHILGLEFIYRRFNLSPEMHELEKPVFDSANQISSMYGISYIEPPKIACYIVDNQPIMLFNSLVDCIWTPGHSPGSLCYYFRKSKILIGGDVLFEGSIGRTDLPGGDYNTLIRSIKSRLYPLGNDVIVYPGHGGITTIGQERLTNPFLNK
jgi:glyoxylase-like metal-dependent hydrolase (beta-lactamase superfamily II)